MVCGIFFLYEVKGVKILFFNVFDLVYEVYWKVYVVNLGKKKYKGLDFIFVSGRENF